MEVYSEKLNAFNVAACSYDVEFTETPIGILQRERVHHFLKGSFSESGANATDHGIGRVLEINCGTGEDALWLSKLGYEVVATDASSNMIEMAKNKIAKENPDPRISISQLSFDQLREHFSVEKFDCIFSNFSGLNCVSEHYLKRLASDFSFLLKPHGKLIAVIMGRKCLWERFYFLVKGKFREAFRRNSKEKVEGRVGNEILPTWYYSPKEFRKVFREHFLFRRVRPVGLFIPPSYLNCFFADKKFLLGIFNSLEKVFSFSLFGNYADHYFIELQKTSNN